MTIRNLDTIFKPRSVAVIGAGPVRGKVGNTVLRNLIEAGFEGDIYPIHPKAAEVEGRTAYTCIGDTPSPPDLTVVCTPAATVPELVRECGEAGTRGLIVLSAGFREMNEQGRQLEQTVREAANAFAGLRIVGPNCLGVMSPWSKLNAGFAAGMPQRGLVAFISQSGALCTAVLDWARSEDVGFSHFVSVGNMLDVGFDDLIDYFEQDPYTDAIVMYIESINRARPFLSAARSFSRSKPIIACKSGRFVQSAQAAASHTGAMAGVDAVYDAAFDRAGIIRVFDIEEMFDTVEYLAKRSSISGGRLAIVTNAGGPGVMATDALLERKGMLASLDGETIVELDRILPPSWSHRNPIDVLGDAPPERLESSLRVVLRDANVDAILVVLSPQAMTDPTACAEAVVQAALRESKPILTSWLGGAAMADGIERLNRAGVPTYATPERAIRAYMHSIDYRRLREALYETPHEIVCDLRIDKRAVQAVLDNAARENRSLLLEQEAKEILKAYGIRQVEVHPAADRESAVTLAAQIGYPVALKLISPDVTHKTDVGGVELNLTNDEAVRNAFDRIRMRLQQLSPDARFAGVAVQSMIADRFGRELIVGATRDPVFGSVLMVGAGGVASEILNDRALEFPPLNEQLILRMLETLRIWPLLKGYRGRPGVDVDRLAEVLMRISYLVSDFPQIIELDINPLLATPDRAVALDARMVVASSQAVEYRTRYSHLAIRPYPSEFLKAITLKDQTSVLLRPIKPEDEPRWRAMIESCSAETLHARFGCLFDTRSHQTASRYCFIDYDRELAVVAEISDGPTERKLIGIGRLVADADHQTAEFALLVVDSWQGKGIGSALLDHCLALSREWGLERVTARTSADNTRMLHLFQTRGFQMEYREDAAFARKRIESTGGR